MSLCKQVLGVRKTTSNKKFLAELGGLPFKIYIERAKSFQARAKDCFIQENVFTCASKNFQTD